MPAPTVADARNRALRTFLQGVGYAVLAAAVMVLLPVFTSAKSWADFNWSVIAFALAQAVGMAVLSYVMRKVLDPSRIPTPTPPGDGGHARLGTVVAGLILLTMAAVCVALLVPVLAYGTWSR